MYAFEFRHDINLLDIQWTGLFTPEIATRYARELIDAFRRSGFRPGYRLRIDMNATTVQPKDAIMTVHQALQGFPAPAASRWSTAARSGGNRSDA
ncbi:hypothetical protein P0F65_01405 [Sphingomonas sp. I4]